MRVLLAAVAALLAGGAGATPTASLPTPGPVTLLAADGPLAAAVVRGDGKSRCTQIWLWRPGSAPVVIKTQLECDANAGFLEGIDELALGGQRVLWEETNGGNNLELIVNTATLAKPKADMLSYVESGAGAADDPGGDYTGDLYADGPLLVFTSWTSCDPAGGGYGRPCQKGTPDDYNGVLHQVASGKDTVLLRGDDALWPIWVDGGRILVHHGSQLILLRTSGDTLRTFAAGAGYEGAVFQGKYLVVLRPTALDVFDTGSGAPVRTFRLAKVKGRQLVDVQSGIAVLTSGGAVHLLRLDSGRGATVRPAGGGPIHAQLEPGGLFTSSRTRLAFLPMAKVLALFR